MTGWSRAAGSDYCGLTGTLDCAVDGGAGDAEDLGEFGAGVASGTPQLHEVQLLGRFEFGLLAAQPALGSGDLHALPCPHPDEVRFEFSDHREAGRRDQIRSAAKETPISWAWGAGLGSGQQFAGQGVGHGGGAAGHLEFGEDVLDVVLGGAPADVQGLADVGVGGAVGEQPQHLQLA